MQFIIAKSRVQIIVFVFGAKKSLSSSSEVKNSTRLSSCLIKSIEVAERLLCHFFSKNLRKLLRVIM
ncbi:MAG: hypothetical protein LBQ59_04395 [Candidatus Peribacteria bacterium]|jgi:hypothetical protein|nr:hypothetical protein [Candidatus Peribacteria bacterium]